MDTMARRGSNDCEMNLKATELSLALPGSDKPEQPTCTSSCISSRKRSITTNALDDGCVPPSKSQIVGWPPIQSYRRNVFESGKAKDHGNGSGLYVKVNLDGAPYLRKIDLKACKSYGELLEVMEDLFDVKIGSYSETEGYNQSDYTPSYQDKDGDWMLVGDVPWEMFVSSCKRLRITKSFCL